MYGLDINFLNDRAEQQKARKPTRGGPVDVGDRRPLYIGIAVAIAILAGLGGYWLVLRNQTKQLLAEQRQLDDQLAELQSQLQEVSTIQAQTQAILTENQALVSVFEQIRPWSALLQDVQNRIPARVQLNSLRQVPRSATAGETPPAEGEGVLPPADGIQVTGVACSFDDVNDFVLTLQRSPFLEQEATTLVSATLGGEEAGRCPGDPAGEENVRLVEYTITSNINNIPASELLQELERNGTVGLVARIRALQQTGVVQP